MVKGERKCERERERKREREREREKRGFTKREKRLHRDRRKRECEREREDSAARPHTVGYTGGCDQEEGEIERAWWPRVGARTLPKHRCLGLGVGDYVCKVSYLGFRVWDLILCGLRREHHGSWFRDSPPPLVSFEAAPSSVDPARRVPGK